MKIHCIELRNYRKLKSARIDFDSQTTLFVGANNSGKTSAMLALQCFLATPKRISLRDITLANWRLIDQIGRAWEEQSQPAHTLTDLLPSLDVWLEVPLAQIHQVVHILPSIDWSGGLLGVRLQYEPKDVGSLEARYQQARVEANTLMESVPRELKDPPVISPQSLTEYLSATLNSHLALEAYVLDPTKLEVPENNVAKPQLLPQDAIALEDAPFSKLIRIDVVPAQRELSDLEGASSTEPGSTRGSKLQRRLSDQLREYFDHHLDPEKNLTADDVGALAAIQTAERAFDGRLKKGFDEALSELGNLGYPGVSNPPIVFNTQLKTTDGMRHGAAIQYQVGGNSETAEEQTGGPLHLPENYAGLGYQNLISMVFLLMRFRDDWLRMLQGESEQSGISTIPTPTLHLVLVEEPEVHMHAQVQQVFINNAYELLRNDNALGDNELLSTQLVVSTHSTHVAHEASFSSLRYFRRHPKENVSTVPITTVANLSQIFGTGDTTERFVKRYLKFTHCDLLFADAAIFVEGSAERILVPQFIRHHFPDLARRYTSLVDLGGSHAHRFRTLVEGLGITTLVISDLDAGLATSITNKEKKEQTVTKKVKPERGKQQVTSNPVLKSWHPCKTDIDDLLDYEISQKALSAESPAPLYVTYQQELVLESTKPPTGEAKVIPRTFEDALVFANDTVLKDMSGTTITNKIRELVAKDLSKGSLEDAMFELLKNADKAAFALDCLMNLEEPKLLSPPPYIAAGLMWLQNQLDVEENEIGVTGVTVSG